jgi:hypothetical protein
LSHTNLHKRMGLALQRATLPGLLPPASSGVAEIELGGKRYISPARLASLLGVTVRTLSRWHAMRVGPTRTKIGRLVLIPVEKLPSWLESHAAVQPLRDRANLKR